MQRMIGKFFIIIGMSIPLMAREYTVPLHTKNRYEACQAYCQLSHETCYWHEPVVFTCSFEGPKNSVTNVRLTWDNTATGLYVYPQPHVQEADHSKRIWTWSGVWYPSKTGEQTFPLLSVTYEKERRRKGRSGMLGSMWGGFIREQKEIDVQGSGDAITVLPIPERDDNQSVHGVGDFSTCQWHNVPDHMTVGASYEIQLQITGAGNLVQMEPPQLQDQPGLHWFHVGGNMEHPVHAYQRTYTYAVYVTEPGIYTLSTGLLFMFDPEEEAHYECDPGEITVQAFGDSIASHVAQETQFPDQSDNAQKKDSNTNPRIRTVMIPFSVVCGALALPIGCGTWYCGVHSWHWYQRRNRRAYRVKQAFRALERAIRNARTSNSIQELYWAWEALFDVLSSWTDVHEDPITYHIQLYMPEQNDAWDTYWNCLIEHAFYTIQETSYEQICNESDQWKKLLYARWKAHKTYQNSTAQK